MGGHGRINILKICFINYLIVLINSSNVSQVADLTNLPSNILLSFHFRKIFKEMALKWKFV